ncbi:hypothetical protein BDR04DRAFT_264060 [Suillus decipiens]|nr:hypothetical protein BDR04DRAFT_264060 [Suillus decipiens]
MSDSGPNTILQTTQTTTPPCKGPSHSFPFDWEALDSLILWCIYYISNGHANPQHKRGTGKRLHDRYLQRIQQISVVQGLVLTTAAVFTTTVPPLPQDVDYISHASYACLAESLVFSLFGLLFQLKLYTSGSIFQEHGVVKDETNLERWKVFGYLLSLVIPVIIFGISVVLLLMAVVLTAFTSHIKTVQLCVSITFSCLGACYLVVALGLPSYFNVFIIIMQRVRGKATSGGGSQTANQPMTA